MKVNREWTLLDEIASICEAAFRRGFQHGSLYCASTEADADEVLKWRFDKDEINGDFYAYAFSVFPPWKWKGEDTALERLEMECSTEAQKEILNLFYLAKNRVPPTE